MNMFSKYKERMIVTFVAIILIVIIGITASGRENITKTEGFLGNIITPIQKIFYTIGDTISDGLSSVTNVFTLRKENEELKSQVSELSDKVRKYENVVSREEFLKNEYELIKSTQYNLIKARLIGRDPGNWFGKFMIDKGIKDGVQKGDVIVQGIEIERDIVIEGVVGRVTDVGDNWAKVMTIIDSRSSVSFTVSRTQDGGIGKGNLEGVLSGQLFDINSKVIKGDKVFTSGLGGVFTKDLYIGEVNRVIKRRDNLLLDIEINPAVDFSRIRDVFVIRQD